MDLYINKRNYILKLKKKNLNLNIQKHNKLNSFCAKINNINIIDKNFKKSKT